MALVLSGFWYTGEGQILVRACIAPQAEHQDPAEGRVLCLLPFLVSSCASPYTLYTCVRARSLGQGGNRTDLLPLLVRRSV